MSTKIFKVLMVGDVFAEPGIKISRQMIPALRAQYKIDLVIVNAENSAKDGKGLTEQSSQDFFDMGVDYLTTGNHVWKHEKFLTYLQNSSKIVRPANFPSGAPGKGFLTFEHNGVVIGLINLMGRTFFKEHLNCPFKEAESLAMVLGQSCDIILIDFHAEATSEKIALAFHLDGKVGAVVGTHTHVQTADNRVLPKGTAFMTDLGFCGALNSCIGVEKYAVINHQISQLPARFKPELDGPLVFSAALITFEKDQDKFRAVSIERIMEVREQ